MKSKRVIGEYSNNNCWMCLCKWISFTFLFMAKHKHQRSFVYCKQKHWNSGEEIERLKITKLNFFHKFGTDSFILLLASFGSSADVKFLSFHCEISENFIAEPKSQLKWNCLFNGVNNFHYSRFSFVNYEFVRMVETVGWSVVRRIGLTKTRSAFNEFCVLVLINDTSNGHFSYFILCLHSSTVNTPIYL